MSGKTYDGEWKDDLEHGKGKMKYKDAKEDYCIWKNGKFVQWID